MLATCLTSAWFLVCQHACLTVVFFFLLRRNQASFQQVWYLLFYFLLQSIALGYLGEDFFVVFALAAELPVFLGFFFFYIAKSELSARGVKKKETQSKSKYVIGAVCLVFLIATQESPDTAFFNYNIYTETSSAPQKSDFFVFFLYYYLLNSITIVLIGILITLVTLILVLLAFKNQIVTNATITSSKQAK